MIAQASLAHPVAELCNHVYSTLLMLLTQFFDPVGETRQQRDIVQAAARRAMSGIVRPLAEVLTTLPATADASGPTLPRLKSTGICASGLSPGALDAPHRTHDA